MRSFLKQWMFVLIMAGLASFLLVSLVYLLASKPDPVAEKVHIECLDGFEYYARSFPTYYGTGVALAPRWDKDGKPKRCSTEKEKL